MNPSDEAIASMLESLARLFEVRAANARKDWDQTSLCLPEDGGPGSERSGNLLGLMAGYRDAAKECREAAVHMRKHPS